jgi:hypothetical protein
VYGAVGFGLSALLSLRRLNLVESIVAYVAAAFGAAMSYDTPSPVCRIDCCSPEMIQKP